MESFLNKVEREANEEVKRIHREAQQIVDVLKALKLEIPKELQHIVFPVSVEITSVKEATEKERKKGDHSKRIAKMQAKAEAEYQQTRAEIQEVLRKGPKTRNEVLEKVPRSKNRVLETATRMKKDGELEYSKGEWQGPAVWYLVERPVTLEELRDEVVDRKGGDIPLQETQTKLGFQQEDHLIKMLDELAAQGIIAKTEDGAYENYMHVLEGRVYRDTRTFHEKKKYFQNSAVAGTGRFKATSDHEVQGILDKVKSQGGKVRLTNGGHIQVEHDGKTITIGKSPSRSGILQDKNRVKQVLGLNV